MQFNAQNLLGLSNESYDNLWQEYRDIVEFAFTSGQNESDRINLLQLAAINNKAQLNLQEFAEDRQDTRAIGGFINDLVTPVTEAGMGALASWAFDSGSSTTYDVRV